MTHVQRKKVTSWQRGTGFLSLLGRDQRIDNTIFLSGVWALRICLQSIQLKPHTITTWDEHIQLLGQCFFRSSFFHHSFLLDPLVFETSRLTLALSFATVFFFHVPTHSTRAIFLTVIKLFETHQYSRPHSCISFFPYVTGQTIICPSVKCVWSY